MIERGRHTKGGKLLRAARVGEIPSPGILVPLFFSLFLAVSCNPFAPALEEGNFFGDLLGDPTTVNGFFTNFKNAYELRDISLYEPLLDSSFIFVYYDFDALVEREWGFAQELASTQRLFRNASLVNLRWNQILSQEFINAGLQARVVRSFNLIITLEGGDAFRGDGNVNFLLDRADSTDNWQLRQWRDESEF